MWHFLYNLVFIPLLYFVFSIGKFFNNKIKIGFEGRENLFLELESKLKNIEGEKRIWFHSSSLGEFEQAKPIISSIKKLFPNLKIIVTFFSPSGYLHAQNYKLADIISYIPVDSKNNAKRFLEMVNPILAIMIRYDVWPNFTWQANEKNIPLILVNGTFKDNSRRFFPLVQTLHQQVFDCFSSIFTVSENDKNNFEKLKITQPNIIANGDTRFDQVFERSLIAHTKHLLPTSITNGKIIFIAAQTWKEDEEVIFPVLAELHKKEPNLLTIVVPHEPTEDNLERIENECENSISNIRFSLLNAYNGESIIIVDSVGILIPLYQYCKIAYVGGSFRQGIHNVLEPAVFGLPIIFGPTHLNSQESVELKNIGGAFAISNSNEFSRIIKLLLTDDEKYNLAGNISKNFIAAHRGATERFTNYLFNILETKL